MAYRLRPKESPVAGIPRICREQIDHGLTTIHDQSLQRPEAVHEARKCCKRIRGALRLVRPRFDNYWRAQSEERGPDSGKRARKGHRT